MSELPTTLLLLVGLAGGLLGTTFYGGLWWTVRQGLTSTRPALWFAVSLVLRTCVTLGGFYVLSAGRPDRVVACLLGFVAASVVVTRATRPSGGEEPGHAPVA